MQFIDSPLGKFFESLGIWCDSTKATKTWFVSLAEINCVSEDRKVKKQASFQAREDQASKAATKVKFKRKISGSTGGYQQHTQPFQYQSCCFDSSQDAQGQKFNVCILQYPSTPIILDRTCAPGKPKLDPKLFVT